MFAVEVLNYKYKSVARRRIKLQRIDRCFCLWHCLCGCSKTPSEFSCQLLTQRQYRDAGFHGSLPIIKYNSVVPEYLTKIITHILLIWIVLLLILLLLGK